METDANKLSDTDVIALAQVERDAGVPDRQTAAAAAAADATERLSDNSDDGEVEAHPS